MIWMAYEPRVSVIIPVFNREAFIGRAVESLLAQTFRDYEIIVVDDGSTDGTQHVLNSFGDKLKVFSQSNRGPYTARNLGLQHARGEYIAFLDSDDTWLPERLTEQVPLLSSDPGLGLVFGDGQIIHGRGRKLRTFFKYYNKPVRGWVFPQLICANFIPQSSVLVRRKCFEELGPFLEIPLAADYHKWLQIALCYRIEFVNEIIFTYTLHEDNISLDRVKRYQMSLGIFEELANTLAEPDLLALLRRRRIEREYELGLSHLREGIVQLLKTMLLSREGTNMGSRLLCLLRVIRRLIGLAIWRSAWELFPPYR